MNKKLAGHLIAIATASVWGLTFISTKVLLRTFEPVEILLMRFVLGYIVLWLFKPKFVKPVSWKQEVTFAAAGLSGVTLYYLVENTGLEYTLASNAGVIIATAPFFTAVLAHFVNKREDRFRWNFFVGFAASVAGIFLISFNGAKLQLNPLGDMLIVVAALCWAVYSVLLRRIYSFGHHLIITTRRIFAWGILFMLPVLPFTGFSVTWEEIARPENIGNLLFLGIGACACCFLTWNYAVSIIGAVRANFYIYLTPVITLVASVLLLDEPMTGLLAVGTVLTLFGLVISEMKFDKKPKAV